MKTMSKTAKGEDWKKPGARCFFILINEPGSPLYDGTIISVNATEGTAKVEAICRQNGQSKDPVMMTVSFERLREEKGRA